MLWLHPLAECKPSRARACKLGAWQMDAGMDPVMQFFTAAKDCKKIPWNMLLGIDPVVFQPMGVS